MPTGAAISFLACNEAKRTSVHPDTGIWSRGGGCGLRVGQMSPLRRHLIPLLTWAFPATPTAVLLGALTMQGIAGPNRPTTVLGGSTHGWAHRRQYLCIAPPGRDCPGLHRVIGTRPTTAPFRPGPHSGHAVRDWRLCHRPLRVQRYIFMGVGIFGCFMIAGHARDAHGHRSVLRASESNRAVRSSVHS